jgi:hypothetical protein
MRPLSAKTMIPCRTDRSILKVIVMLFGPVGRGVCWIVAIGFRLTKMQHGSHIQSTETKGLEEKWDDGNQTSVGFPAIERRDLILLGDISVFLDPQLLNFRFQRRPGNSEFRCRTFWAGDFPFAFS